MPSLALFFKVSCFSSLRANHGDSIMESYCLWSSSLTACPLYLSLPFPAVKSLFVPYPFTRISRLSGGIIIFISLHPVSLSVLKAMAAFLFGFHPFSYLPLQIIHCVLSIFQVSLTSIFLSKVSASGVLQESPSGTCLVIFFKFLGCGCS